MITKEQITSAANADSAELLKQGVSSHTAGVSRCAFIAGAKWAVEQTKGSHDALRAVISHLEAENAALREGLKEGVELIESGDNAFPTHSAPKVLRMAKETLKK
mgnify:FL=1